jgi:hypothetical protein
MKPVCFTPLTKLLLCHSEVIRCYVNVFTLCKQQTLPSLNTYLVINKCITTLILPDFSCHYLYNCSTLNLGVFDSVEVV